MLKTSLNGTWSLFPNSYVVDKNTDHFKINTSLSLTIPGEVHTALLENGIIEDPYYGENESASLWVSQADWIISRKFDFTRNGQRALLILKNVNTVSKVMLNGKEIGCTDNFFARYLFDITDTVKDGENEIAFYFVSTESVANKRAEELTIAQPYSTYPNSGKNRNLVRTPQCSSGSPWSPNLQGFGILNDIEIQQSEYGYLKSWNCIPRLENGKWICNVEVEFDAYKECKLPFSININGSTVSNTIKVSPKQKFYTSTLTFDEEKINKWYPAGMGNPSLYPLAITFGDNSDKRMIGFRTIEVRNDVKGDGQELTFVVNGKEVFCKGANWVLGDALLSRFDRSRTIRLLQSAAEANMNMIRVWGGGIYESEDFYDTCDRFGLLVWQDMMLSCATYPSDDWFLESVKAELEYQIPRLKSHPSIALWCGDSENIEALGWYEETKTNPYRYITSYDRLNHGVEELTITRLDPTRKFWPSSPCGGPGNYDNRDLNHNGDLHYWDVWNEQKPIESYFDVKTRFCSEFGFQSFPSFSTVKRFCPESQFNISSPVMEHHQKSINSNFAILENFSRYFRFPTSFEHMLYLSQVQQALALSAAISYWRSLRPYCMGTLIWQLNDSWPCTSWSAIEYGGKWKLALFEAKKLYAQMTPLSYVKDDTLFVYAANDTADEKEAKISVKFASFKGEKVKHMVFKQLLPPESMTLIAKVPLRGFKKDEIFAYIKLSTTSLYREDLQFLTPPKHCKLQDAALKCDVRKNGKNFNISLSCTYPSFYIALDAGALKGNFSDNFFSIRPTAGKTVTFTCEEDITLEEFKEILTVTDLYKAGH